MLRHVQKSIIQIYLQKVTLQLNPPAYGMSSILGALMPRSQAQRFKAEESAAVLAK